MTIIRPLCLLVLMLVCAVTAFDQHTSAIGSNFFDMAADSAGVCDTYDWDATTPKCNSPARLVVGQTTSVPYARVHVKSYFRNLAKPDGTVDPAKVALYDPFIIVSGSSFCPSRPSGWNTNDYYNNGYFDTYPDRLATGTTVTAFRFGGRVTYNGTTETVTGGTLAYGAKRASTSGYCDPSNAAYDPAYRVQAAWLKPEPDLPGILSVDFLATSIDRTPATGGCVPGAATARCNGFYNGFGLSQRSTTVAGRSANYYTATVGLERDAFADKGYGVTIQNYPRTPNGAMNETERRANGVSYVLRFGTECGAIAPGAISWRNIKFFDLDYGSSEQAVRLKATYRNPTTGVVTTKWKTPGTRSSPGVSGSAEWQSAKPFYSFTPRAGAADILPSRNGTVQNFGFHAEDDWDYAAELINNTGNLVFQYGLPFDAIYGVTDCPQDANFKPRVDIDPDRIEEGGTVTATASIENMAAFTDSATYQRTLYYSDSNDWRDTADQMIQSGTGTVSIGGKVISPLPTWSTTASGSYKYVCTKLTITSPVVTTPTAGACSPIGKYPSLRVINGDVRSGGGVPNTSVCTSFGDGMIVGHNHGTIGKGSLAQYAALARGKIANFGSANFSAAESDANQLFFGAKAAYPLGITPDADGYFHTSQLGVQNPTTHCLPNLSTVYPSSGTPITIASGATIPAVVVGNSTAEYTFEQTDLESTLTIPAINLVPNQRVSVRVNGPSDCSSGTYIVRLTGNVTRANAGPYTSAPWFSVVATSPCIRIVVNDAVDTLYGLYATEGSVMTCQGGTASGYDNSDENKYTLNASLLTSDSCNAKLTINGAMVAGTNLHTYRTFGDGTGTNPAETFNLDPVYLISDYVRSREGTSFYVQKQLELPPRF